MLLGVFAVGITIIASACATMQVGTALPSPPPVERPSFVVGERWLFAGKRGNRNELVYQGRRGEALVFRRTGSSSASTRPTTIEELHTDDLALITQGRVEYRPDNGALRFPLAVGKSWRHPFIRVLPRRDPPETEMVADVTVKAYERITVPAGALDAFRIESAERTVRDTGEPPFYATYWYAPAAKTIIKYRAEMFWSTDTGPGGLNVEGAELAQYESKP